MDAARGLGIVLVVFGHVERGLNSAGMVPGGSVLFPIDYLLYTFHMPLFFFLAGINAVHSRRRGPGDFLGGKLWTVAYPYFLWSLIQGSAQTLMGGAINHAVSWPDLLAIPWRPISPFWFLYALFVCHVLMTALPQNRRWFALFTAGFYALGFLHALGIVSTGFHFFFFYGLGVLAAPSIQPWLENRRPSWWHLALLWLLFAISAGWAYRAGFAEASPATLPASLLGLAGTVALARRLRGRAGQVIEALGIMSLSIFVMHILAASGTRIILLGLGVIPWVPFYLIVGTVVGVGLPVAAHLILQRWKLLAPLGLAAWTRKPRL